MKDNSKEKIKMLTDEEIELLTDEELLDRITYLNESAYKFPGMVWQEELILWQRRGKNSGPFSPPRQ